MVIDSGSLADALRDARSRTLALARVFAARRFVVPKLATVNPALWELGHTAWFAEYWMLRRLHDRAPILAHGDALYDSAKVAHATRWDLPLPSYEATLAFGDDVLARVQRLLEGPLDEATRYFAQLTVFHEDMHGEASLMTAQTLRYPWPLADSVDPPDDGPLPGDVEIPAGRYRIGAEADGRFAFDNEKWAHDVEVAAFRIARAPVTNAEYRAFIEDSGHAAPLDWARDEVGAWRRRHFDAVVPLRPHAPVYNLSRHEAEAFCRWAGRRLPTEAEWEIAATYDLRRGTRTRYPWGDGEPTPEVANLDARVREPLDVAALPGGDSPAGLRQTIGNVWEWTASAFAPYPGFIRDPYAEYSEPWFGNHAVLRGGAWTTRGRLVRGTWRNFYRPERSDAFAGFRTCASSS